MTYGHKVLVQKEIRKPSKRREAFKSNEINHLLKEGLDFLKVDREMVHIWSATHKGKVVKYNFEVWVGKFSKDL